MKEHAARTIATYDQIAASYHLIATPENRAWLESAMRDFYALLPGQSVLVGGCGEGRDSRYLRSLGAEVGSFDLSQGMLAVARSLDPQGEYRQLDLRAVRTLAQKFHGIWACACLYHLTKTEFRAVLQDFRDLLHPGGILFVNLKLGTGEQFIDVPRAGYPGGEVAQEKLAGSRFYAFYSRQELTEYFSEYEIVRERRDLLKEGEGAMEFLLRNPGSRETGARSVR